MEAYIANETVRVIIFLIIVALGFGISITILERDIRADLDREFRRDEDDG